MAKPNPIRIAKNQNSTNTCVILHMISLSTDFTMDFSFLCKRFLSYVFFILPLFVFPFIKKPEKPFMNLR